MVLPERWSLGIVATALMLSGIILWHRISGGLFWCWRKDFQAIGGFDEDFVSVEDMAFAKRLKAYGKRQGKRHKSQLGRRPPKMSLPHTGPTTGDPLHTQARKLAEHGGDGIERADTPVLEHAHCDEDTNVETRPRLGSTPQPHQGSHRRALHDRRRSHKTAKTLPLIAGMTGH